MAETPEHLQKLIDVVDDFCRKWRMDINLKKSEIMVANEEPSKST
jgi:ATP-dependent protease HslVU (ClpYQ) peptidase subunit